MEVINKINKAKNIWEVLPELSAEDLEKAIKVAADSYYNESVSLLSDDQYDILVDQLKMIKPQSKIFKQIGAPIKKGKKVKLPYWMGSMNKVKTEEEIDSWTNEYPGPYVISDKLDGISCLLVMSDHKIKLYTRGDGLFGQEISHLLDLVNTSHQDLLKQSNEIALRGELIMSKDNFKKYEKTMANARNLVGGIVNSKPESVNKKQAKDVDFVSYEVIEPKTKPSEQMKLLKKWGLNVVTYDIYEDVNFDIIDSLLQKRRKKSIYEIDGIIVTDNKVHSRNQSGNPDFAVAYKGASPEAHVKVIAVLWTASKDGILIPIVKFEKTPLSGVQIEHATGFNAKYIQDNNIGPGAIITIIRSGDTIPYIKNIVKPAKKPALPKDVDYEWDKNEVNIVLSNPEENQTVIIKRLTKFLKDIGVEYMSEGIVTKLVKAGYDNILKIISLTEEDLLELEGFQETLATKLINGLNEKLEDLDILKLMVASNAFGRGLGEKKIRRILNIHPKIVNQYNKTNRKEWIDKLMKIEGFDTLTINKFLDALPDFQQFYKNISKIITIKPYKSLMKADGLFKNEIVVFTGFRNKDWQDFIEKEGGRVSTSISKNTTLLVYNDAEKGVSSKYKAAEKLGIKTISKSEFAKKYNLE